MASPALRVCVHSAIPCSLTEDLQCQSYDGVLAQDNGSHRWVRGDGWVRPHPQGPSELGVLGLWPPISLIWVEDGRSVALQPAEPPREARGQSPVCAHGLVGLPQEKAGYPGSTLGLAAQHRALLPSRVAA